MERNGLSVMENQSIPWKQIIEFHREIAIRSEESFFSFGIDDRGSDRFSYLHNKVVDKMNVDNRIRINMISNTVIFANNDQKNNEFYVGGIFWFTNKKSDNGWVKIAHPLFYKPYIIKKEPSGEYLQMDPEQARWNVSPMFYKLLEKKGVVLEKNLDEVLIGMIEDSSRIKDNYSFEQHFLTAFIKEFPDLKKEFIDNSPRDLATQWLVFVAPKDFSAIQRNLILDYSKLITRLSDNPEALGGFEIFQNHRVQKLENVQVMPIVPLNDNQLRVVEKVLAGNETTVVSGPPGCGKSQVVISILLNAWKQGRSALFASSNNQAVNVVRDRMRQFERKVPMVVRCGARKTSELTTTLGHMIDIIDSYDEKEDAEKKEKEISELEKSLNRITSLLETNLPQRIDELARAALGAYGKGGEYKEEWEAEIALYEEKLKENGIKCSIDVFDEQAYKPYSEWMDAHSKMLESIKHDEMIRDNLNNKIEDLKNQSIEILSLNYENATSNRLITHDKLNEIKSWYDEYKSFLLQFIEEDLQEVEWSTDYDEWKSAGETQDWIDRSDRVIAYYNSTIDRYLEEINEINARQERLDKAIYACEALDIRSIDSEKENALSRWVTLYNKYIMIPKKFGESLPFSEKSKLGKELTQLESIFLNCFGSKFLIEYAPDSTKRREYISLHSEKMLEEYSAREAMESVADNLSLIRNEQKVMNDLLNSINMPEISDILDISKTKDLLESIEKKKKTAGEAKKAFEKKERKKEVVKRDRDLKFRGSQLLYPLMEGIKEDSDISRFFELINGNIYNDLSLELLQSTRDLTYKHAIEDYLDRLDKACSRWDEIDNSFSELKSFRDVSDYQSEWMEQCPKVISDVFSGMSYNNTIETAHEKMTFIQSIHDDWNNEGVPLVTRLRTNEQQEYEWAWETIEKALELCPDVILPDSKENILTRIREEGWDVSYIRSLFSKIDSAGIMIKQKRIKSALEEAVLSQAISSRMKRLADDHEAKAALSKLLMGYRGSGEMITPQTEGDFETILRALPVWITTGQSPQSIPMNPGLFDLLIIDEATQCTITSILPLIYRCKKIIVIGDMDQLPSIDNISIAAEKYLADKYSVEDYLYLLGHCGCNIYKSVLNMIPVKEGNVVSLTDHYRSHPLIIGFANYYVYKNRLVLKKPMKEIRANTVFGMFGINVVGEAYRDRETDSWCNLKEADAVIRLIKSFKSIPEYEGFSIGVITPFRGQVKLIYDKTQKENMVNVLVSTVHKYQGDEKDIIIFSPVVAKGIAPGTAKWVENPQNLINVAITRAREALYVVSDYEVCRRQPGILGNLIRYTEKIELLRKTSLFELQLFGLMVLQGWEIEIHPVIRDIEVDFIVSNFGNKIVVEVDGSQHEKQKVMDQNRDALLASNGYDVIRIPTREIADTPFEAIEKIRNKLNAEI